MIILEEIMTVYVTGVVNSSQRQWSNYGRQHMTESLTKSAIQTTILTVWDIDRSVLASLSADGQHDDHCYMMTTAAHYIPYDVNRRLSIERIVTRYPPYDTACRRQSSSYLYVSRCIIPSAPPAYYQRHDSYSQQNDDHCASTVQRWCM